MKPSCKYHGILLGHVTPEQSSDIALNKAGSVTALEQRSELLKLWILPLLVHPTSARAVYPDDNVCFTLQLVYRVALKMGSWGVTQPILSLPKEQGGYGLASPKAFLHWQFSMLFVRFLSNSASVPAGMVNLFTPFQTRHGIVFDSSSTFTFQMGCNVVWNAMPYLAWSAHVFPGHPTGTAQHACLRHTAMAPPLFPQLAETNILLPTANPRQRAHGRQPA